MLTSLQRQRTAVFCRYHQIAKLWLLDGPLPDGSGGNGAGPTAIVAFRTHWRPDYVEFTQMGFELNEIIGPGAAFYPALGLPPAVAQKALAKAAVIYGHSPLDDPMPDGTAPSDTGWQDAVARFCRQRHIARLWALNRPRDDMSSAPTVLYEYAPGRCDSDDYISIFKMQDELGAIIGPGATMYSLDSLPPDERETICRQAEFRYAG